MGIHDVKMVATTKEVEEQLSKLADNIRNKALTKAMNKVLTPPLNAARKLAPNRSGLTKKALTKKVKKYASGTVFGLVGVDSNAIGKYNGKTHWPNKIFHFLEDGVKPHNQPKRGKGVMHPGAKPKPIIAPVFHSMDLNTVAATFADNVQEQVNKLTGGK